MKHYRPNVAAIIVSPNYPKESKLFIALRNDVDDAWQFPQGGIDGKESPKEALFRELQEEIGTCDVEIIAEHPEWISYDFDGSVQKKMYPFDGQTQKYFLVRLRDESSIDLATKVPEFSDFKFVEASEILGYVAHFKKSVYEEALQYFTKEGYL